eukprot:CAMPEP_0178414042 /NCGR_PEP_ID=MMETSP0689_2-20121128/22834_1 /TAXON_ID=160604 /ORGANISM="Amphidinium massartii, Strain CS-259" /LENGTH=285 /DNA_ID=CAMNT_0020035323 /DNA_START=17 /DNA_END=874 /DNA_ORIENTATION=+
MQGLLPRSSASRSRSPMSWGLILAPVALLLWAAPSWRSSTSGFVNGSLPGNGLVQRRTSLRAAIADPGLQVEPQTFYKTYNKRKYKITQEDEEEYSFELESQDGSVKTGKWHGYFNMPWEDFEDKKDELWQQYRKMKRKLRKKHGNGDRYPNGDLIFLRKMQGHPFLVLDSPGNEKYMRDPEWIYDPNEAEVKEQAQRAKELRRKLMVEAEEKRLARAQELGMWTGDPKWRQPWSAQIDPQAAFKKWGPKASWPTDEADDDYEEDEFMEDDEEDEDDVVDVEPLK